jgi:hypothetical protein
MAKIAVSRTKSDTIQPPPAAAREVMGFKLEHGVPVPPSGAGRPTRWPFETMAIGESFSFTGDQLASIARNAAAKYGKIHPGYRFIVRQDRDASNMPMFIVEDGKKVKVYRCWRVQDDAQQQ